MPATQAKILRIVFGLNGTYIFKSAVVQNVRGKYTAIYMRKIQLCIFMGKRQILSQKYRFHIRKFINFLRRSSQFFLFDIQFGRSTPITSFAIKYFKRKKFSSRCFSIYCRNLFKTFWEKSSRKTKWVYMKRIGKELSGLMVNIPDLPG